MATQGNLFYVISKRDGSGDFSVLIHNCMALFECIYHLGLAMFFLFSRPLHVKIIHVYILYSQTWRICMGMQCYRMLLYEQMYVKKCSPQGLYLHFTHDRGGYSVREIGNYSSVVGLVRRTIPFQ